MELFEEKKRWIFKRERYQMKIFFSGIFLLFIRGYFYFCLSFPLDRIFCLQLFKPCTSQPSLRNVCSCVCLCAYALSTKDVRAWICHEFKTRYEQNRFFFSFFSWKTFTGTHTQHTRIYFFLLKIIFFFSPFSFSIRLAIFFFSSLSVR